MDSISDMGDIEKMLYETTSIQREERRMDHVNEVSRRVDGADNLLNLIDAHRDLIRKD
jgi:hypothetical protein